MKNKFSLRFLHLFHAIIAITLIISCNNVDDNTASNDSKPISKLKFIGEYIIPDNTIFNNTKVGGLSGIDYANGSWYIISDDSNTLTRFYTADITFDLDGFKEVAIKSVVELKDIDNISFSAGTVDPETIRINKKGDVVWCSEGNVNNGINPFLRTASKDGLFKSEAILPEKFKVGIDKGPRNNGVFEGLTLAKNDKGYWVAMELPLIEDGTIPTTEDTTSPVRISYVSNEGVFGKEFAYELSPVARPATNGSTFELNGLVEIVAYDTDKFLVLERSFSSGYSDGGNNVVIYDVDASNATDVSGIEKLDGATYTGARKKLLLDFETVRSQLTNGIVDNIEGVVFGPNFANGNRSLVLVADNNFSAFTPQLNQLIVLEVID